MNHREGHRGGAEQGTMARTPRTGRGLSPHLHEQGSPLPSPQFPRILTTYYRTCSYFSVDEDPQYLSAALAICEVTSIH
jgi:hypothetical protein